MKKMHSLVLLVLFSVLASGLSESCPRPSCQAKTFQKLLLDDVVVTQDALAEVSVTSKLDCGRQCVGAEQCVMFTFLPNQNALSGDCQMYRQLSNSTVGQEDSPGARSYAVYAPCDNEYSLMCGRCLMVVDGAMTYQQGQQRCQQLGQGHLIFTKTLEDLQCAAHLLEIKGNTDWRMFVGADDLQQEGHFVWNDGCALDSNSQLWGDREPNNHGTGEDCAAFHPQNPELNDIPCEKNEHIICEKGL